MINFRRINYLFSLIGIIIIIIGLIKHQGIPYQDPTPEMLNIYNKEAKLADELQLYGFYILLFSLVVFIIEKIISKIGSRFRNNRTS